MSPGSEDTTWMVTSLVKAAELAASGSPSPPDMPRPKRLAKMSRRGWLIISRAAKYLGESPQALLDAAAGCPALEVGRAEPPRLFGLFPLKAEPAVRLRPLEDLEGLLREDPVGVAKGSSHHRATASRVAVLSARLRSRAMPGKLERPPKGQRFMPPTPSREALFKRVDPSLVEAYAVDVAGETRPARRPRSPLRFSDGHPARDLSSAIRLLVTASATEVAARMRDGTLSAWFRDEAAEPDLAAVVDAAAHVARERREGDTGTRALLLKYLRRTPVGADLERGLIEPMADALRSRDGALVASTAEALLLLDADLAAAELSSALFETEVAGRAHVIEALGETGSPRAVAALERLAKAASVPKDRSGAMASLRRLAQAGAGRDVARAALERLGEDPGA